MFVIVACSLLVSPQAAYAQTPPYPPSPVFESITWDFANAQQDAGTSDIWPTTWASDGDIYTALGDGKGFSWPVKVSYGSAKLAGDPESYTGTDIQGFGPSSGGGKIGSLLSIDGTLWGRFSVQDAAKNYKIMWSDDDGVSWSFTTWSFPDSGDDFRPAAFINFGQDYAGARDTNVYIYGGELGFIDDVYLARVPKAEITTRASWDFFTGLDGIGDPIWDSDVTQRAAVFTDPKLSDEVNGSLKVSAAYNSDLSRYILTMAHGSLGKLGIFDAPEPWGPWTTVAYYENWNGLGSHPGEALYYHFPTKWISNNGTTMWMIYSATGIYDSFNLVRGTLTVNVASTPLASPTGLRTTVIPQ